MHMSTRSAAQGGYDGFTELCFLGMLPPRFGFRSLMEQHVRELEDLLDGDLVDALDDNLGQQMEDNYKEKVRYTCYEELILITSTRCYHELDHYRRLNTRSTTSIMGTVVMLLIAAAER